MQYWRKKYYKNFTIGLTVAVSVHIAVLAGIFFLTQNNITPENGYYYLNSYTVRLAETFSPDTVVGGGSFGNGINGMGSGPPAPKTLSGIPVPSAAPDSIEFGNITNLEVPADSITSGGGGEGSGTGDGSGEGSVWGAGYKTLPFVPRQILEAVPQNVEGAAGTIILMLKIGADGFVKEDRVIYDTTNNPECLRNTKEAAYKSRWEQVKMEGKRIRYWIEKRYNFD